MQTSQHTAGQPAESPSRPDPTGFVMSVALTVFMLTIGAVITMHLATQHGWQVL
jgi:hypothetical protein